MSLAPKFLVLRSVNGHFEPPNPEMRPVDNLERAEAEAKAELSRAPDNRFAIFEMRAIVANTIVATVEPVQEKAA